MDTQHFKEKLEAELALINSQLAEAEHADIDPSATEQDEIADRFEEEEEQEEEREMLGSRRTDVEDALAKIEAGSYGKCEECGEPIEADRIEANPAARTCTAHLQD